MMILKTFITRRFVILLISISFQLCSSQVSIPSKSFGTDKLFSSEGSSEIDFLRAIERATEILETAEADAKFGVQENALFKNLDQTKKHVDLLFASLKEAGPNMRNQLMYRTLFKDLQEKLYVQNKNTNLNNDKLVNIKKRIGNLKTDTVLMALVTDSTRRSQYRSELLGLKSRYSLTDSIIQNNMRIMTSNKRLIIDSHLKIENALLTVEKKLDRSGINLIDEEYPTLWHSFIHRGKTINQNIRKKWITEKNVVGYYVNYNSRQLIFLSTIAALLIWLFSKNMRFITAIGNVNQLEQLDFKYLNQSFLLSSLIIFFNIIIGTNLYAPALFTELSQLFLLASLTFLFRKQWTVKALRNWYYLCGLYVILCFLDLFVEISFFERCMFICINILCIRYGIVQFKDVQKEVYIDKFFKWGNLLFITLNFSSIIFNVFGRVTLSHTLTIAAIIALTQTVALSVLLKIAIETVILQIFVIRSKRGIVKIFDHHSIFKTLNKPFTIATVYMWIIVISSNLNILAGISGLFTTIFNHKVTIGSVSFTIGGVFLFFLIVWIAHLLRNYVAYFFGEINEEDEEHINKKQHSKLLIARLIVLILGYLLAAAASGLPMDKLSIIIGALGVGVGLGLQNIVTNFVSGIILIFDRPIQVGDIIDVNSQSGRVKSMGLRSTKIDSNEGAEIIIPNGNILSQNITNWTYTDNLKLVDITFSVSGTTGTEYIKEIINNTIQESNLIDKTKTPQVFFSSLSDNKFTVVVKFWCSIYRTDEVLSTLRQHLYTDFKKENLLLSI